MTDTLSSLRILLTNNDGINAPGVAAICKELATVGDVTVVAPAEGRNGIGRVRNERAVRRGHPWGYALEGTPADCIAYALHDLDVGFDIVVSGINDGPNTGNCVVGRSGTVGTGVEAAFLGIPAVTASSYHTRDFFCHPPEEYDFPRPARVTRVLTEHVFGTDVFNEVDLPNVNAPAGVPSPRAHVTRPFADYDQQVNHNPDADTPSDGDREHDLDDDEVYVRLQDTSRPDSVDFEDPFPLDDEHRDRCPVGGDHCAIVDSEVSVSPLAIYRGHATDSRLAGIVENLSEQIE